MGLNANLLGDNRYTIKRNTETLIYACGEVGLEIHVLLSRHQSVGQNRDIAIANIA
jgi:hypothetical protein